MTVSIMNTRDQTYWGSKYDDVTEDYELLGNIPERSLDTLFELIDAGTEDNVPTNTKPRPADLKDTNKQKFFLRFNETMILRAQSINKYVGTTGVDFQAEPIFVDEIHRAERFRILPVFNFYQPDANPIATNENLEDSETYIKNGTLVHMINTQLNYVQKIENLDKIYFQGPGKSKKNLWKKSDIFQFVMLKPFEE